MYIFYVNCYSNPQFFHVQAELYQFKKQSPHNKLLLSRINTCILSKTENKIKNR